MMKKRTKTKDSNIRQKLKADGMAVSPVRLVDVFTLRTEDGETVHHYNHGRKFTLDPRRTYGSGTYDPKTITPESQEPLSNFDRAKTRAEEQVGKPCRWVKTGTTEMISVFF